MTLWGRDKRRWRGLRLDGWGSGPDGEVVALVREVNHQPALSVQGKCSSFGIRARVRRVFVVSAAGCGLFCGLSSIQ